MTALLGFLLCIIAIFMILLILVQRGRGGGLAGALGGMGGSSAFGAKAGDVFTRITAVAALIWIVLCMIAAKYGATTDSRVAIQGPARNAGGPPAASAAMDAPVDEEGEGVAAPAASEGAAAPPANPAPASEGAAAPVGESAPAGDTAPANND